MNVHTTPASPICLAEDGVKPCPYWQHCHEARQRTASGQRKTDGGLWMAVAEPLRGEQCWAYQGFQLRAFPRATEPAAASREPGEDPF